MNKMAEICLVFLPALHNVDAGQLNTLAKSSEVLSRVGTRASVDANAITALKALSTSPSRQTAPPAEVALLVLLAQYEQLIAKLPTATKTEFHAAGSGYVLAELLRGNCSVSEAITLLRDTPVNELVPVVEPAWLTRVAGVSLIQCNHNDVSSIAKSVLRSLPISSRVCVVNLGVTDLDVSSLIQECGWTVTIESHGVPPSNRRVHAGKI
jgi:hypothetical protein